MAVTQQHVQTFFLGSFENSLHPFHKISLLLVLPLEVHKLIVCHLKCLCLPSIHWKNAQQFVEFDECSVGDATSNQTTFQVPQISSLMQNPEVLAALQDRLGSMIGSPSGYIQR